MKSKLNVAVLGGLGYIVVVGCYIVDLIYVEKARPSYVLATLILLLLMGLPVVLLALCFFFKNTIKGNRTTKTHKKQE